MLLFASTKINNNQGNSVPNHSAIKKGKFTSWILVFATLFMIGLTNSIIEANFLQQALADQQQETRIKLSTLRTRIEGVINNNISLIIGFASVISSTPDIDQKLFDEIGRQVLNQSSVFKKYCRSTKFGHFINAPS